MTDVTLSGHGGQHAVEVARAHGVETMFTLSGAHVFPMYDGAVKADPAMRLVDVRHEQTAAFAAEATGKLTRAPGLAVLTAGPFVQVGGQPAVLLNVLERRFVVLGVAFWPQDFALVVLVALTLIVGLALSTVAIGRVWCGWLCPQTVFLEMVFRRLEYLIEGSAAQQLRRARGPWTAGRAGRAAAKHALFFALSFAIANLFLLVAGFFIPPAAIAQSSQWSPRPSIWPCPPSPTFPPASTIFLAPSAILEKTY